MTSKNLQKTLRTARMKVTDTGSITQNLKKSINTIRWFHILQYNQLQECGNSKEPAIKLST
jgi:hypothetical protein